MERVMAGTLMRRNTPVRLELTPEEIDLMRAAAYREGKPLWQFISDATMAHAKLVLQKAK